MHDPWESRIYIYSYCVRLASTFVLRGAALKLLSGSQVGGKRQCSATLCLPIRVAGRSSTFYSELRRFGMEPKGIRLHTLLFYRFFFRCIVVVVPLLL